MFHWCPFIPLAESANSTAQRDRGNVAFEVRGKITYTAFQRDTQAVKTEVQKLFLVIVNGCSWRIQTETIDMAATPKDYTRLCDVAFDGTNMYRLTVFDTNLTSKLPAPPPKPGLNVERIDAEARVTFESVPYPDPNYTSPLWLAFASHCYLAAATNDFIKPVYFVRREVFDKEPKKAAWTLAATIPFLPETVSYFRDGMGLSADRKPFKLPPPFDAGFREARYETAGWTNVSGLAVPTAFTLSAYSPNWGGKSTNDLVRNYEWRATVASVRKIDATTSILPKLVTKTLVVDGTVSKPRLS